MQLSRDDAVLAVRLWGLATSRYVSTMIVPLNAPDPELLYAGLLCHGEDPVQILLGLSERLSELAGEWSAWADTAQTARLA